MSTLKKTLETQKEINKAVEDIFNHFRNEVSYAEMLETVADAQIEFMLLLDACHEMQVDGISIKNINNFIFEANSAMKLLRPFAKLIGQVYGTEE